MMSGGFSDSARVRQTNEVEILLAIVDAIRHSISELDSDGQCFVSDTEWPDVDVNQNLFCTVKPGKGKFDQSLIDGSGHLGVAESVIITVTVWSRVESDQVEHFVYGLTDPDRGLLVYKQRLLKVLAGKYLYGQDLLSILIEALSPVDATTTPQKVDDFASVSIAFDARFWWNLGP